MTTLITGGTGFIGLAVAEKLIASGTTVRLFGAEPASVAVPLGAETLIGDIRDGADIDRALEGVDRVIHMAAMTPGPERERTAARAIIDVNIGGTVTLVERIAARGGISRLVALSSVAVYGHSAPVASGVFEEDVSPPAPASLYGITKLAAEQSVLRLGDLHGLDVCAVRLGPAFGPWENPTGMRDALSPHRQIVMAALEGREVVLPRAMRADWIYSRDAAVGIAGLLTASSLPHRLYNLGGGVLTDLIEWCGLLERLVPGFRWRLAGEGQASDIVYNLPKDRAALGIARLGQAIGYRPGHDLAAAAADYLAWIDGAGR